MKLDGTMAKFKTVVYATFVGRSWDLTIPNVGVTSASCLDLAESQVMDYLETLDSTIDRNNIEVTIFIGDKNG